MASLWGTQVLSPGRDSHIHLHCHTNKQPLIDSQTADITFLPGLQFPPDLLSGIILMKAYVIDDILNYG